MSWLRSAIFNLWFHGLSVAMAIAGLLVLWFSPGSVRRYARLWALLSLGGLRLVCGIRWDISGREHLPPADGPALIAAMHQSTFDVLLWMTLAPRFAYVMKQELVRVPAFGALARAVGTIVVDRGAGAAAMRGLLRAADEALAARRQIVIFPEGTRVAPGMRAPLQPGVAALAARTRLPIIPVVTDSGLHWGRRAFRKRPGTIRVAIQPPIPPGLSRAELMTRLTRAFDDGAAALSLRTGDRPAPRSEGDSLPSRAAL
jgi:1-acyl-sn-glycerol-3-phosphate acyltransferase